MHKFILPILLLLVMVGCSIRTESTNYHYNPAFTRDGKIIFVSQRRTADKDSLGSQISSSRAEYLTTIYPTGTGESSSLLDVTDVSPAQLNYSPTGDYLAFFYELRNGAYGKLAVYHITTEAGSALDQWIFTLSPRAKSFDWSASGDKLIYCTTSEVYGLDFPDGDRLLATTEAGLQSVSWKYGTRIAVSASSEGVRSSFLLYDNGSGRISIPVDLEKPQISGGDTNEAFGLLNGAFVKVNLTSGVLTTIEANFTGENFSLSPDGSLVTYSAANEDSGVYIMHTATGTIETVKP